MKHHCMLRLSKSRAWVRLNTMGPLLLLFLLILGEATLAFDYLCSHCQPEQVHISFGEKSNDIVVTWTTLNDTMDSYAVYGVGNLDQKQAGSAKLFQDGGSMKRQMFIHQVTLANLSFDTDYIYHVGSVLGWSEEFFFKTPPEGEEWVVRAAIFGDMGVTNAQALSYLQDDAQQRLYDVVLHVGDMAYDLDTNNAIMGDLFMRQLQPLAAYVPYMVCPGNHESEYNFSNYKARFPMPTAGGGESMFYSFDLGRIHFIAVSTEFYYFLKYGISMVISQFHWLKEDLEMATSPENREKRPWIVLFGHRPMYCSNNDEPECLGERPIPFRTGMPVLGLALEPLLMEYGVDIAIWAHEHSYERSWPLYDNKVYNGSLEAPYTNPRAPVHIVTGSAGNQEFISHFQEEQPEWSAFRSTDYGYTVLEGINSTHLHFQQISVKESRHVIDDFWVIKEKHGPFELIDRLSPSQSVEDNLIK